MPMCSIYERFTIMVGSQRLERKTNFDQNLSSSTSLLFLFLMVFKNRRMNIMKNQESQTWDYC